VTEEPNEEAAKWRYLAEEWERQYNTASARANEWEARHDVVEAALSASQAEVKALQSAYANLLRAYQLEVRPAPHPSARKETPHAG